MGHDDQASADMTLLTSTDEWGVDATLAPYGGEDTAITGVLDRDPASVEQDASGRRTIESARFTTAAYAWDTRDVITIDDQRWEVVTALEQDASAVTLQLRRVTSLDKSGPSHRGRT